MTGTGSIANPFVIAAAVECDTIRACISAGPGITYNEATGVISATAVVDPNVVTGCGLEGSGSAGDPLLVTSGAWPYPCDVSSGSFLYCDADGVLRSTPPHTATQNVQQTQTAYPDIPVPLPDDTQIEIQMLAVVNPDPCREAFVIVEQEMEISMDMPINSTGASGIGTDDMMFRFNNGNSPQVSVHSQHTKVIATIVGAGVATVTQMRVTAGRGTGGATIERVQTFLQAFILTIRD
ncbi:hypothetical protein [Streptomyces sp. NBC_01207]|uniref:hypothetical protein n=1 Tax=Streptomyces sp. NBC_01207 TaxID=2903772 RepID=UPI002E149958|nr:hypothetical protein OG457_27565 [Streptomyces sp. NBC_01207]